MDQSSAKAPAPLAGLSRGRIGGGGELCQGREGRSHPAGLQRRFPDFRLLVRRARIRRIGGGLTANCGLPSGERPNGKFKPATIGRRVAAIRHAYRLAGIDLADRR